MEGIAQTKKPQKLNARDLGSIFDVLLVSVDPVFMTFGAMWAGLKLFVFPGLP